jgi:hypothetical protein
MAQLGCGKNWSGNQFSFENFEFCGIQIHQSIMTQTKNYGVKVHIAYQPICTVTHIWIYSNFTLVSKVQSK